MEKKQTSILAALGFTGLWLIVALFVMSKHEIWLDEAQHWLLARDSNSFGSMIFNMRYEGHAPLWNVLLFFVSRITQSYVGMQILHLLFAATSVFVVVRYSPFPLWVKLLLPFTYFFGFEYAILSRNYAPAVLFLLLACINIRNDNKRLFVVPVLLGIAVLFHSYAGFVALPLLYYWFRLKRKQDIEAHNFILPAVPFVLMLLIAAGFSKVPGDHFLLNLHLPTYYPERFGTILLLPFTAFMHFPELSGYYWWNSNLFLPDSNIIKAIIGLAFWSLPALTLKSCRPMLILYLVGIGIISIGIFYTPTGPAVRHAGIVAVLYFVCLWIGYAKLQFGKLSRSIIGVMLAVQVLACITSYFNEVGKPFSHSKNVAAFIRENYPDTKVVVYPQWLVPSVSMYLGHKVYVAEREEEGSFANWKSYEFSVINEVFVSHCKDYMRRENLDSVLLVVNNWEDMYLPPKDMATEVATFNSAAVSAENYNVYILKRE